MTFSNNCFTDNKFIGRGVVIVEGSSEDFVSSGVTGTIDPSLACSYASIGYNTCANYDTNWCSALIPANETAPPVPIVVSLAPSTSALQLASPSTRPSSQPSGEPSTNPSLIPSSGPTKTPSAVPSSYPSSMPSSTPSVIPSATPSTMPVLVAAAAPSIEGITSNSFYIDSGFPFLALLISAIVFVM